MAPSYLRALASYVPARYRRVIARLLARVGGRDAAPSAATWDEQYVAGRWAYLGELAEMARFSVLAGYLRHFKPGGAILDVGCGEGVLAERLPRGDYRRYVGVDLSAAAIEQAGRSLAPSASWIAADAQTYAPTERFDAIVFNEVVYFFSDPAATVERYAGALNDGGILLFSINTAFRGGTAILADLKRRYATLDETRVTHGDNDWSWVCTALARTR
jgi:2-polyprenyl-3-methyl-5-hydroxy-6-metoxy-1,4-benzoquinol methylase